MNKDFEFDKIVGAIALAIFLFIFSDNIGDMLYHAKKYTLQRGYQIEVEESSATTGGAAAGIPDQIDIHAIMAAADAAAGEAVFKKCTTCHTPEKGGANKVGPNLWGIVGKKVATTASFDYSKAMVSRGAENISWSYEELYRYLYAPKKYVPGTKMAFAGIKKDVDRANLIAYLRTLSDKPNPLP
jgi:cytochrome c